MKRVLFQSLEKTTQDDNIPMEKFDAYCTYHQRKGHATNFYKALEVVILDLISQERYEIDKKNSDPEVTMNIVLVDKEVCIEFRKGHPIHIPNSMTTKQVSVPPNPKTYSMIEQLKTTPTKISLYVFISTFETYREILYALFKKEIFPINMIVSIFIEKLRSRLRNVIQSLFIDLKGLVKNSLMNV